MTWNLTQTMNLIKAAGHKYTHRKLVGRDPKTNRARYRYYYARHHGGGITSAKFEEGAAFKLTFKGRRGHFHINRVEGDKVYVTHDGRPGSKEVEMSQDELRALLEKQHSKLESKSREKAQKRRKSATKKRKSTKRKKPREQLTETAAQAQQSADNFETMPEETQAPSAEYKETRAQILRERSGDFDRQKLKELEKRLKTQTGPDSARASEEHINSLLTLARTPEMKRLVDNVVAEHKGTTPQTQLDAITEYMTEKAPPRAPLPEDQSPESLTYELAKVRERATADLNRASRGELLPPTIAELEAQRDAAYDAIPSAPSDARLKAQEEYYRREALATATRHVYSAAISEAIQNRTGQQIQQLEQLIFEKKQERAEERAKAKEAQAQQSAFKDLSTEDRAQISTVVSELDKTGGKILNVEKQGDGYVVTIDPFSALDERPTRFSFGRSRGGDIRSSGLQESSRGHAADAETNAHVKTFGKRLKDIIKNDERFESFYMIKRPKKKRVRDGQTWFPVDQDEENYFVFEFETAAQAEDRAGQGVSQTAQAFKEMVSTIKSESKGEAAQAAQKKFKAGLDEIIEKTKAGTLTDAERAELLPITEELVGITSGRARNLMIMIREQVKASSERRGG